MDESNKKVIETIDINKVNSKINILKNEYTEELNTVNYYYWPIVAKYKRRRKDLIWYFTLSCCLLFSVVFLLIFEEVTNEYWIGISLSISGLILFLSTFFMIRLLKKYKKVREEWKKALTKSDELNIEINSECEKATKMMYDFLDNVLGNQGENLIDEIGTSYEDILNYYNHWVDNN